MPDSFDGRFELIALHAFLILHRLKAAHGGHFDAAESDLERALIETLFADLDRALREEGVGDTGVSRRIKAMANAFYGRLSAYGAGMKDTAALKDALTRNLYGTTTLAPDVLDRMIAYVEQAKGRLAGLSLAEVETAEMLFPTSSLS